MWKKGKRGEGERERGMSERFLCGCEMQMRCDAIRSLAQTESQRAKRDSRGKERRTTTKVEPDSSPKMRFQTHDIRQKNKNNKTQTAIILYSDTSRSNLKWIFVG